MWNVVASVVPEERDAKWLAPDGKARAAIGPAVEESQKILIKIFENSKRVLGYFLRNIMRKQI